MNYCQTDLHRSYSLTPILVWAPDYEKAFKCVVNLFVHFKYIPTNCNVWGPDLEGLRSTCHTRVCIVCVRVCARARMRDAKQLTRPWRMRRTGTGP